MGTNRFCFIAIASSLHIVSLYSQVEANQIDQVSDATLGVAYSLPKTTLYVDVEVQKTTTIPGEFANFAERFIGEQGVAQVRTTQYKIVSTSVHCVSTPDKNAMYLITSPKNRNLPEIFLSQNGVLSAVNRKADDLKLSSLPVLTRPTIIKGYSDNPKSIMGEEFLVSGSTVKMAEIVAKKIFSIRESKNEILTGQSDQMPKDGEALKFVIKQLNEQEERLMTLFIGNTLQEKVFFRYPIEPKKMIDKQIIFRFSQKLGMLDSDDLGGEPFWAEFLVSKPKDEVALTEKEMKKTDAKGLVYLNPSNAILTLRFEGIELYRENHQLTQYADKIALPSTLFSDPKSKIQILFNPALGNIVDIQRP